MCTYTSLTVVKIQIKRNKEVRGEKKPVVGTDASREGSECMVIGEFKRCPVVLSVFCIHSMYG